MPTTSAGTVYLDVKLNDQDFLQEMSKLSSQASAHLQKEFNKGLNFSSISKDISKMENSLKQSLQNQTQAIDHIGDMLQNGIKSSIEQGAAQGAVRAQRIGSNIKMPKISVELDRTQLEEQLSVYSQRWQAIDDMRIAKAKQIKQIEASIQKDKGGAAWGDQTAIENITKLEGDLAKAQRQLSNIRLEAMKTDQVVVQLERNLGNIGQATDAVKPMQVVAHGAASEAERATKSVYGLGSAGRAAGKETARGMRTAAKETSGFEKAANKARGGLRQMLRVGLGLMGIRSIMLGLRRLSSSVMADFKLMAGTNQAFANSLNGISAATNQMKGAFSAAVAPLVQAVLPALQKIVEWATKAFNAIAIFFAALAGKKSVQIATGSTKTFTDGLAGAGGAADKARKATEKYKRTLAGFDELEILSFPEPAADAGAGGGGGGGGADTGGGQPIFETVSTGIVTDGIKKMTEGLQDFWEELSKTKLFKTYEKAAKKAWANVEQSAVKGWGSIKSGWEDAKPKIVSSFQDLAPKFAKLWVNQASYVWLPLVSGAIGAFLEIGGSFIGNVLKGIGSIAELGAAILSPFIDSLNNFWDAHGPEVSERIYGTFATLKEGISGILDSIGELFSNVFGGLAEWWEEKGPEVEELFTETWSMIWGFIKPIWDEIDEIARAIFGGISDFFHEISEPLKEMLVTMWDTIWKVIKPIWETINEVARRVFGKLQEWWGEHGETVKGIFSSAWEFITGNFKSAIEIITRIFSAFGNLFSGNWSGLWEDIKSIFVTVWERIGGAFSSGLDFISGIFSLFGIDISGIVDGLKQMFSGLTDFLGGVFTGDWSRAWNGIKEIFSGIWNALKGLFVAPINWIIDKLNWFIRQLNRIKIPDWVPLVGGKGINIREIGKIQLARGGIVDQPTLAMVGEQGQEAVMPLEHNTGWISKLAAELAARGGLGSGEGSGDIELTVPIYLGTDTLIGVLEAAVDREGRLRNKPVFG